MKALANIPNHELSKDLKSIGQVVLILAYYLFAVANRMWPNKTGLVCRLEKEKFSDSRNKKCHLLYCSFVLYGMQEID